MWFFLVPEQMLSLVSKFHVALHASHAVVTLQISPYANATLTSGWITMFMGDMGEGALHQEERNCQTKKFKPGHGAPKRTGRQTVGRNQVTNKKVKNNEMTA
jgi:hypothetical protein